MPAVPCPKNSAPARPARATLPATRDPWLARWLTLIGERAGGLPVLELGCGGGRDSAVLVAAGLHVVGVDLLGRSRRRAAKSRAVG